MKKLLLTLLLVCHGAFAQLTTIDGTIPAANSPLQSAPIRANFLAAKNSINSLIQQNAGTTAPSSPVLGQLWLNTSATPYVLNEYDGTAWVSQGKINASTHAFDNTGTINGNTVTAGTGTLTIGAGKTATVSNTLTLTGTDGSAVNFGAGGTVSYGTSFSALMYSYTGTLTAEPKLTLSTPSPSQLSGVVGDYSGKWASSLTVSAANSKLTGITFTDLQGFVGTIGAQGTNNLSGITSISYPALTTVTGTFQTSTNPLLTTFSTPLLAYVGGNYNPATLASLTTLSAPSLVCVGLGFTPIAMASLTTLSASALTTIGQSFTPSSMAALTTFSFPVLATVGGTFSPATMASLVTMSLPALTDVGGSSTVGISITSMASLTTVSFGALVRVGTLLTSGNAFLMNSGTAAVTSLTINANIKQVGTDTGNIGSVVISSAALNQASVDALLVALAQLDGTNGTTAFSNRTVTITGTSATPSATGIAAKATLVARGCTVTTN